MNTIRIMWRNRTIAVTPLEDKTVALLMHVEASVWAQGLGPPAEAHELRHSLDDAFRNRPEEGG